MFTKNIVGGEFSSEGKSTFQSFNPELNRHNAELFFEATSVEAARAAKLAKIGFEKFQKVDHDKRASFLRSIRSEMERDKTIILDAFCAESGLSRERGEKEFTRTVFQLSSFADLVEKNEWIEASIDTSDHPAVPDLRKQLFGIGPVLVFGASNFPLAYSTMGGDSVAALAAGCPVIVKAHPSHAKTSGLVASAVLRAIVKNDMPPEIFSHLYAVDFKVAHQLVQHEAVKAVGFTGSFQGGKALFDLANNRKHPIPVFAEMGSVNPTIVFTENNEDKYDAWAQVLSQSMLTDAGQFCTNPGLIFIQKSSTSKLFIHQLEELFLNEAPKCMLNSSIAETFREKKQKLLPADLGVFKQSTNEVRENYGAQAFLKVDAETFIREEQLREEVFGSFSVLIEFETYLEILSCLEVIEGQLTGSVFVSEEQMKNYRELIQQLTSKVGRVILNGVPTGVRVCPSMNHGGPFPATTDSRFTAVGIDSIYRFARPVSFQNFPDDLLPKALRNKNSFGIARRINGEWTKKDVG